MDRRHFLRTVAAGGWAISDRSFRLHAAPGHTQRLPRTVDITQSAPNVPVPVDDGACQHLAGMAMPAIRLRSTNGRWVDVRGTARRTVFYCYPRTGRPGEDLGPTWDEIPGARGCTSEACAFRDHHADLHRLGADVYGVSSQDMDYQQEMVIRLRVPFEVLSDEHLRLTKALRLPTFRFQGMTLIKRLTLIVRDRAIEKVFYPVFPPDGHATEVITWLTEHPTA